MYRPSRLTLAVPVLAAMLLVGACSSGSDEATTAGSAPVVDESTPEESTPDPAVDTTVDSSVASSEAAAPATDAPAASPSGTGDFCVDLKNYQLTSQERVGPVVLGQGDEGEYLAWVDGVLDDLVAEGPSEAKDFLTLQKSTIPTLLEATRNGNVGVLDILEDPEYQAAYGTFTTWVSDNCSQDVVDIILMGTGGA